MRVDYIETKHVNQPIYDALSTEVGQLTLAGDSSSSTVGFIATIDGSVLGIDWNPTKKLYEVIWDSWVAERWKLNKNVFDLEIIKQKSRFPAWINTASDSFTFDLSGTLPDGGEAVSYTVDNFYNYQNEDSLEFIVSSSKGKLLAYTQASPNAAPIYNPDLTTVLFDLPFPALLPSVNSYISTKMATSDAKFFTASVVPMNAKLSQTSSFSPADNGYWLFIGSWAGNIDEIGDTIATGSNDIAVYYLAEGQSDCGVAVPHCAFFLPVMDFNAGNGLTLANSEATGIFSGKLRESSWMPKVTAANFLGSDTKDLVVTNGELHLLETTVSINPSYGTVDLGTLEDTRDALDKIFGRLDTSYVANYFKDINDNSKGRVWSSANPVDFDGDGDLDMILGFARYNDTLFGVGKSTMGMTYFENQGSNQAPVWVEQSKAVTNNDKTSNFRVANYTDPVFIYSEYDFGDQNFDYINGYHPNYRTNRPTTLLMTQVDPESTSLFKGTIRRFVADYSPPTALMAATYPEVKRIDINLKNTYDEVNYGFHIFETWDNEEELQDWTLSLATADLDDDGKNEVIVGDFNNNVFVFEHLSNNSYKRAFKTFDVNRTVLSDNSPYANEQFAGISGTYYSTLFEHVQYVIAGFDLNQNGLQEFIAATDTVMFVFEAVYTTTGMIRDDTYKFITMIDLLDHPALVDLPTEKLGITAISWADDFTDNGRKELLVASGPAMLIFEISDDSSLSYSRYSTQEIFFGNAAGSFGLFDTPGNYYQYPYHNINSILVEDLDLDGTLDVVIAGRNEESARPIWSGFISVLEYRAGAFYSLVDKNTFDKTTQFNPINDLAIDDADMDGNRELIIGHEQGIDIYEFNGVTVSLQEVITSNPAYQLPQRGYFDNTFLEDISGKDVVRNGNLLKMVYVGSYKGASNVYLATSTDNGITWITDGLVTITGPTTPANYVFSNYEEPNLLYKNGELWMSIVIRYTSTTGGNDYLQTWFMRNVSAGTNAFKYMFYRYVSPGVGSMSPVLFDFDNSTADEIGILTIINSVYTSIIFFKTDFTSGGYSDFVYLPWARGLAPSPASGDHFYAHTLDMIQLSTDSQKYGLVFSGYRFNESLSMDMDLYYSEINMFSSANFIINATYPIRTFSSGLNALYPSIIQEAATDNLMISFEQSTQRPFGGLWAIWSSNDGNTWTQPYDMSHPTGIDRTGFIPFPSKSKETFTLGTLLENIVVRGFESQIPVLVPGATSGYTMVYDIKYMLTNAAEIRFGLCAPSTGTLTNVKERVGCPSSGIPVIAIVGAYQPFSNFTWFDIGRVQKLKVGDSDADGRHEILAATEKRATLLEFLSNSQTNIAYKQKWISSEYSSDITDVAISDVNGNGYAELLVESDRGIVHAYEVTDLSMGQSDQLYPIRDKIFTQASDASNNNIIHQIITIDATNDGIDDIFYYTGLGQVGLINGATMTTVYLTDKLSSTASSYNAFDPLYIMPDGTTAVLSYNSSIHLIDIATGNFIRSRLIGDPSNSDHFITSFGYMPDSATDLYVGAINGSLIALSGTDLSIKWVRHDLAYPISGDYIRGINVASDTIFIGSVYGFYAQINSNTGTTIWSGSENIVVYSPATAVDINRDGTMDYVFMSLNFSFAIDGSTGTQLWNITRDDALNPIYLKPILYDYTNDGVDDIVYVNFQITSVLSDIIVIDSTNGEIIKDSYIDKYNYKYHFNLRNGTINYGDEIIDVLLTSNNAFSVDGTYLTTISGLQSITTMAGVKTSSEIYGLAVNNFGQDIPYLILGDAAGNITLYKLYRGQPELRAAGIPESREDPFIRVGADFSKRTTFLLANAFRDGAIGDDGIDDIFVVDDYFIGAADTAELETNPSYNTAVWALDVPEFGQFAGFAEIIDLKGNGDLFLVAAFDNALTAVNIKTGAFYWNYTFFSDTPSDVNVIIDDLDFDGAQEIIIGRKYTTSGFIYGNTIVLNFDGTYRWIKYQYKFDYAVVAVANLDGGNKEVIVSYRNATNPYWTRLTIYDDIGNSLFTDDFKHLPWVADIAVGNFDSTNAFDEFILFFELSAIDVPDILYNFFTFPTLYLMLGYSTGALTLPSGLVTLSPFGGKTIDYRVLDIDGDGNDDLFAVSERGDLFILQGVTAGNSMAYGDVLDTLAVPYARNMLRIGDFCSAQGFIFVSSATTVSCYNSYELLSAPKSFVNVNVDIIQDIVVGDLDDDFLDDYIIASRSGYVWIVSSEANVMALEIEEPANNIEIGIRNTANSGASIALLGLISSPFLLMAFKSRYFRYKL